MINETARNDGVFARSMRSTYLEKYSRDFEIFLEKCDERIYEILKQFVLLPIVSESLISTSYLFEQYKRRF